MNLFERFKKSTITNQANVVLGAIVALATVINLSVFIAQYLFARNVSRENSIQTEQLIKAANKNASSALQFADAATRIDSGVQQAVDKLNLQAGALDNSARQASRLARDTEIANANVIGADRPWIGGAIQINTFSIDSKPAFTFQFVNTGRRPARLTSVAYTYRVFKEFPDNPDGDFIQDGARSTSILVPGAQSTSTSESSTVLSQQAFQLLNSGIIKYFAFAKVEYVDLKTSEKYWTHMCVQYFPNFKTDKDNGFRNCYEYNDAR